MDEQQQGGAQQAAQQESPLRRLWQRLRSREPVRPTWRHFALNAAVVPLAAVIGFFSRADTAAGYSLDLDSICFLGFFFSIYLGIPISIAHALWRWLWGWSWRGALWLMRPALLCLAVLALLHLPGYGRVWSFERKIEQYAAAVEYLHQQYPQPVPQGDKMEVTLPDDFRSLTTNGAAELYGTDNGTAIVFDHRRGPDIHVSGALPQGFRDGSWYDRHWYLVTWTAL